MKTISFLLGVHSHQPVGNFPEVFTQAYQQAYLPFLELLEKFPKLRLSLHYSGVLLKWFEEKQPGFLKKLSRLVKRQQVEMLTGGFYEPILPAIPFDDALGQIQHLTDYIQQQLAYNPQGLWLAERVWEPHLPYLLAQAGVKYTIVDDMHFKCAGLEADQTLGYYLTEDQGETLAIFPINEKLRYLIPFHNPEETIEYLNSLATEDGSRLIVMADDGEKFGIWPGTYDHCYKQGWLEKFFTALTENSSWIKLLTFSQALEKFKPLGRVYLPTASYFEMMEWALPARAGVKYKQLVEKLKPEPEYESYKVFIRGSFWRNFLSKYPEGNNIHKKMLYVSEKIGRALKRKPGSGILKQAQDQLWQAQSNCGYWHGIFGGIYLPHLRQALFQRLIAAEVLLDKASARKGKRIEVKEFDLDKDGLAEIVVETPQQNLYFKPQSGAALYEMDFKPRRFNLIDTLYRRPEAYHNKIKVAEQQAGSQSAESIHEVVLTKEKGLEKFLHYDWHPRWMLLDHFLNPETTLAEFAQASYAEDGDFINQPYETLKKKKTAPGKVRLILQRQGHVFHPQHAFPVTLTKNISILSSRAGFSADYEIKNRHRTKKLITKLGIELPFHLLSAKAPECYYLIERYPQRFSFAANAEFNRIERLQMVDRPDGLKIRLGLSPPAALWHFPLQTVSNSESGFELLYQGSVFLPLWLLNLRPQATFKLSIQLSLSKLSV